MHRMLTPRVLPATILAVALVAAGCNSSSTDTTVVAETAATVVETTQAPATTTSAPVTTTAAEETTTTTAPDVPVSVPGTASDSIDPKIVEEMRSELVELMAAAEEVRGLPFIETPTVTILDKDEFSQRVADGFAEDLDPDDAAVDSAFYTMLGMLEPGTDLYRLLVDLYTEQVAGFYDGDTKEMVVPASPDGFTPLQRIIVVHELVHALTDQHFEFNDTYNDLIDNGNGDDVAAMQTLIEGDATHSEFTYLETMDPADAAAAATEALGYDSAELEAAPGWLQADMSFPYDQGLLFVDALKNSGGLAAVDDAYENLPTTTEQVLDFTKFTNRELPRDLAPLTVELDGWDLYDEGSFGEWGLRLMLDESMSTGDATQAAAGWGNDIYREFSRGGDVAVAMEYIGDSERDAEELANALIAQARDGIKAGEGEESGGGLLFDTGDVYVFIDRVDDALYWVVSTDAAAGASLRDQLGL